EWTVTGKEQPALRSRDLYRFEWKVPAGTTKQFDVIEERPVTVWTWLSSLTNVGILSLSQDEGLSEPVRSALRKALEHRQRASEASFATIALRRKLQQITDEQARVRVNINTVPSGSAP